MKDRIGEWFSRWRENAKTAIAQRIVWLTSIRSDQTGAASDRPAIVGIIGREHYEERRKSFPIRSYWELDRVLRLELQDAPRTLTFIGPLVEDHREVAFFELKPTFAPDSFRALFWVPESLLVASTLAPQGIATVERDELTYFVAGSGASQVRGGALRSAGFFALAIGVPVDQEAVALQEDDVRVAFWTALKRLSPLSWLRAASPDIDAGIRKHWKPVAAASAATLFAYLVLASAYLAITTKLRERELEKLGGEVSVLLEKQREVERLAREHSAIAKLLAEQKPVYVFWSLAPDVWKHDGVLLGFSYNDGRAVVRGRAKVATDVLSEIAARKDVEAAKFDTPIRLGGEGMDQQEFAISLRFVAPTPPKEASRG